MRWWPAINESRRALQKHGHTVRMNKKKNVDVRNDIETLIGILNAVLDSLILQMDDTDDRLKELEEMVLNNLIQLTSKEMKSITQKVSKELF
jgi:hypothetical protein